MVFYFELHARSKLTRDCTCLPRLVIIKKGRTQHGSCNMRGGTRETQLLLRGHRKRGAPDLVQYYDPCAKNTVNLYLSSAPFSFTSAQYVLP